MVLFAFRIYGQVDKWQDTNRKKIVQISFTVQWLITNCGGECLSKLEIQLHIHDG